MAILLSNAVQAFIPKSSTQMVLESWFVEDSDTACTAGDAVTIQHFGIVEGPLSRLDAALKSREVRICKKSLIEMAHPCKPKYPGEETLPLKTVP